VPQRPGDILNGVAHLQGDEFPGAFAHRLNDQRDGAGGRIRVRDGEGDALAAFAQPHDDELAGLTDLRQTGHLEVEAGDVGAELGAGNDAVHGGTDGAEAGLTGTVPDCTLARNPARDSWRRARSSLHPLPIPARYPLPHFPILDFISTPP
jgi:hypothetical protein